MRIPEPKDHEPIRVVQTRSGPRYRVVLDVSAKGQPRRQVTKTLPTLKQARQFVIETRAALGRGTYIAPTTETLASLCERWLATRTDVREVTREGYRSALAAALRRLGDRPMQSLKVGDFEALFAWLATSGSKSGGPTKPRTGQLCRTVLVMVFDLAVREGMIPTNPVKLARRPRSRTVVGTDLEHWTTTGRDEQARCLDLETFRDHADTDPLAAAWRLTLCGLTRADVLGLRWSDLDLVNGTATISQGRTALASGASTVDDPKSVQRRRVIPFEVMQPGTIARLRVLRVQQAADRLKAGEIWTETGLVVVDAIGQPLAPQIYSDKFRRLCLAAGVPTIRLHSVRHSLAFWGIAKGVPFVDLAALLGHTVEVFLSTYLPAAGSSGIASAAAVLGRSVAR